jgi:hypothetical protein
VNGERTRGRSGVPVGVLALLGAQSVSDLDVEEHRALTKGTTTAGGYLVPTGFYNQIIRSLGTWARWRQLATEMVTDSGETIQVPANTAHGTAAWLAESGSFTPSDETFAQLSLGAYKASTKIIVSEELLQDSAFDLEAYLAREFGERLGVLENTAFIKGDGSGKPQGLLTSNTASNLGSDVTAATGNATSFNYTALVTHRCSRCRASTARTRRSSCLTSGPQPVSDGGFAEPAAVERQRRHTGRTRSSATRSTPIRTCLRLAPATFRRCSVTGARVHGSPCPRPRHAASERAAQTIRPGRLPCVRACGRQVSCSPPPASASSTARPEQGDRKGASQWLTRTSRDPSRSTRTRRSVRRVKQVKPASQQSSKEIKASIVQEDSRDLHPSGEPEHAADKTSIPGPKYPPLERPPVVDHPAGRADHPVARDGRRRA